MKEKPSRDWTFCPNCKGQGKIRQRIRKKIKLRYQRELLAYEKSDRLGMAPLPPKGHLVICSHCNGSGLKLISQKSEISLGDIQDFHHPGSSHFPHIAIVGAGIGGVALAVACKHRGIPFSLYERDSSFKSRSQGYGLTLQQASAAMAGFGIEALTEGVVSNRHAVFSTDGRLLGEWGVRTLDESKIKLSPQRTNIHIARQALRKALLDQLVNKEGSNEGTSTDSVFWGHKLIGYQSVGDKVEVVLEVSGHQKTATADLIVGADGIRSSVRSKVLQGNTYPLRYLDCIVILGICPLDSVHCEDRSLLDGQTVFQTANGQERIYIMPYDKNSVMWQLSFPMSEQSANELSAKGASALKEEALIRCQWHDPIPQILESTSEALITGYPVYDRALLQPDDLKGAQHVTLIGDAAHPMSPFKGQGANQALLDALALARAITRGCHPKSDWRNKGIRKAVLNDYESEMLERSARKVKDSAKAADFLHSETVLLEANEPRGRSKHKKS